MGIPLYFRYLVKNYPNIILNITKGTKFLDETSVERITRLKEINYLFLDMNCLIHPACRSILTKVSSKKSQKEVELLMLKSVREYLAKVVSFAKPTELLYISIDGPAPKAKMNQQRQRRFRSVLYRGKVQKIKKNLKIHDDVYNWDTNAITPGTKFMEKLSKNLESFLKTSPIFDGLEIIFSNSNVPGEGEHKIFNYIKNNIKFLTEKTLSVYGLDADLIMLSMASQQDNIFLLREAVHFGKVNSDELLYLDIDTLKKHLLENIKKPFFSEDDKLDYILDQDIINDYIFMCFLLGNDFLPHLLNLEINDSHLNKMLDAYYEILVEDKATLINTRDDCINVEFLRKLLYELGKEEDYELQTKVSSYYKKRLFTRAKTEVDKQIELFDLYPLTIRNKSKDNIRLDLPDWKNRYYWNNFNIPYSNKKEISEICDSYFTTLNWIYQYYFKTNCPSWDWAYPFINPPAITDLVEHFKYDINNIEYPNSGPVNPLQQLLIVLPPDSKDLLPKEYNQLMVNYDSPLIEFYPKKFSMDCLYKHRFYMCEPKLPIINIEKIREVTNKIKLKKIDLKRDKLIENITITR
tara:strand:+ start:331 stop:2067 length:1737 start_codon:yes stop_codon:yes gene_type:complete